MLQSISIKIKRSVRHIRFSVKKRKKKSKFCEQSLKLIHQKDQKKKKEKMKSLKVNSTILDNAFGGAHNKTNNRSIIIFETKASTKVERFRKPNFILSASLIIDIFRIQISSMFFVFFVFFVFFLFVFNSQLSHHIKILFSI